MSDICPPMISSSPPPVDVHDDDEDDDTFGDFRVADLTLNLNDFSIGRCSPDALNDLPSPNELEIKIPTSPLCTSNKIPNGLCLESIKHFNKYDAEVDETRSMDEDFTTVKTNANCVDSECNSDLPQNVIYSSDCIEPKPPDEIEDFGELGNVSFHPVFSCDQPIHENDIRTSPEGADSESECVDVNNIRVDVVRTIPECDSEFLCIPPEGETTTSMHESSDTLFASEEPVDEEFTDFADFTTVSTTQQCDLSDASAVSNNNNLDDDFDEFESAASLFNPVEPVVAADVGDRIAHLFALPRDEELKHSPHTSCLNACLDDSSSVWGNLKDLETSNALTLQWTNSNASKKLLSSLNVDSRNVLLGQRWNSSVPRFAANLGCQPLEPKKADTSPATPLPLSRPSPADDVVPAAQFDWNSSGLTNPLDCVDKDEITPSGSVPQLEAIVHPVSSADQHQTIPQQSVERSISDYAWDSSVLPDTDILLPSPVGPPLDTTIFTELNNIDPIISVEEESTNHSDITSTNSYSASLRPQIEITQSLATWTISSNLTVEPSEQSRPQLSLEASRVVGALPDLSFLSARNLLLAANQNMALYKTESRL